MDVVTVPEPPALDSIEQIAPNLSLRHMLVVAGTTGEWARFGSAAWQQRVDDLGRVGALAGVPWITLRPYGDDGIRADQGLRRRVNVDGCDVIVDPEADGRRRFADAVARLDADDRVNEASVAGVLYEPADSEPDLVVVLGPSTALPPSVVWELAYAELVFSDVSWSALDAAVVADAIEDFSVRRRRFGGLDDE